PVLNFYRNGMRHWLSFLSRSVDLSKIQFSPVTYLNEAGPIVRMTPLSALERTKLCVPQRFPTSFTWLQASIVLRHQISCCDVIYLPQGGDLAFSPSNY